MHVKKYSARGVASPHFHKQYVARMNNAISAADSFKNVLNNISMDFLMRYPCIHNPIRAFATIFGSNAGSLSVRIYRFFFALVAKLL